MHFTPVLFAITILSLSVVTAAPPGVFREVEDMPPDPKFAPSPELAYYESLPFPSFGADLHSIANLELRLERMEAASVYVKKRLMFRIPEQRHLRAYYNNVIKNKREQILVAKGKSEGMIKSFLISSSLQC
jgi:hypothetical protein